MMAGFQDHCAELAPLETVDHMAFVAGDGVSQSVCDFVLALAVVYNDCRDLIYAHVLLEQSRPKGEPQPTRLWGTYSGIEFHLLKLQGALVHELFNLIGGNKTALNDDFFRSVVKQLPRAARDAWSVVVDAALGGKPADSFGRSLLFLRNKVSFHYDCREIFRGYRSHFDGKDDMHGRAFLSRGRNMSESRFYFADAAVDGYLRRTPRGEDWEDMRRDLGEMLDRLNLALWHLVLAFVQKRGFAYREFGEQVV